MAIPVESGLQADFFVHPDFHRLVGGVITEEVEVYEAALHERIDDAQLPILIYDPSASTQGDFWSRFPAGQRFLSINCGGHMDPVPDNQTDFNRLLDEREVVGGLVHGSYWGRCLVAFKESLCATGETGILYDSRSPLNMGRVGDSMHPDTVRYGIALTQSGKLLLLR